MVKGKSTVKLGEVKYIKGSSLCLTHLGVQITRIFLSADYAD